MKSVSGHPRRTKASPRIVQTRKTNATLTIKGIHLSIHFIKMKQPYLLVCFGHTGAFPTTCLEHPFVLQTRIPSVSSSSSTESSSSSEWSKSSTESSFWVLKKAVSLLFRCWGSEGLGTFLSPIWRESHLSLLGLRLVCF